MNMRQVKLIAGLTLAVGATGPAWASDDPSSPWSLSVFGGDSVGATGRLQAPSVTTLPNLGAIDPQLAGATGTLTLDKLRYEDLFKRKYDAGLELDYMLNDQLQTYGRFSYEGLGGRGRQIGGLTSNALSAGVPIEAHFADADNKSLELGTRYFWSTGTAWRPFAGAALGATRLGSIRADVFSPSADIDLRNVRFTRSGTVFSQSLETGVEYDAGNNLGVRFSVNADHMGNPPAARDPALAGLGINPGHDAEGRWSFPVSLAATYRFE
jgi:hypothetical protein